jgi:hypothetical protein
LLSKGCWSFGHGEVLTLRLTRRFIIHSGGVTDNQSIEGRRNVNRAGFAPTSCLRTNQTRLVNDGRYPRWQLAWFNTRNLKRLRSAEESCLWTKRTGLQILSIMYATIHDLEPERFVSALKLEGM